MIITKLIGGLGNQMFQYAVGKRAAVKNNTILKLDVTAYKEQTGIDTIRKYELNIFNVPEAFASTTEIQKIKGKRGSYFEKATINHFPFFSKLIPQVNKKYFLENPQAHFEDKILKINDDAYLEGWWHSERYFSDIKNLISSTFKFQQPLLPVNKSLLKEIKACQSLIIHVRLGDYVQKYSKYFVLCDPAYYQRAIKFVSQRRKVDKIYVFVEDPEWIKDNIKTNIPIVNVVKGIKSRDWQDYLQMMVAGKHQIIANSSFSWWGAWLNENPNKIVVAPVKWFQDPTLNVSDRIPSGWIKL